MPNYVNYIIVLFVGTIEQYIATNWTLFAVDGKAVLSSLMGFLCLAINLTVVAWAIKSNDTAWMIFFYCISCAIGNYISVKLTKRRYRAFDSYYGHV